MAGKWVIGMISVIAIAAVAGIGFASYQQSATVTVTANAGSFYLVATATLTGSSLAVGTCTPSAVGASVTLTATNMLPGDYCNWTFTDRDAGSLPGTYVTWYAPGFSGPGCSQFNLAPTQFPWIIYPVALVSPGGIAAEFSWNLSDNGNGQVAGSCSDYNTVTFQAA